MEVTGLSDARRVPHREGGVRRSKVLDGGGELQVSQVEVQVLHEHEADAPSMCGLGASALDEVEDGHPSLGGEAPVLPA